MDMDNEKIREYIKRFCLEKYEESILKHYRKAVYIKKVGEDDYSQPGVSRAGGDPDLNENIPWPRCENGQCMTFLLQLNLGELQGQVSNDYFPQNGMLYVFIGSDSPPDIEDYQIFVEKDITNLKRTSAPEQTVLEKEEGESLLPYRIAFEGSIDIRMLEWEDEVDESVVDEVTEDIYEFRYYLEPENELGKLFGYPPNDSDDYEIAASVYLIAGTENIGSYMREKEYLAKYLGSEDQMKERMKK